MSVLDAAPRKTPRSRRVPIEVTVRPSEDIEWRVRTEVQSAKDILANLRVDNLLKNPYLLSAVYYHDGLFQRFPAQKPDADPSRRIIAQIAASLPSGLKAHYVELLQALCRQEGVLVGGDRQFIVPVRYEARSRGRRRAHRDAVDLFAAEGSPVYSAAPGLVVLAEHGWTRDDLFSTSTVRGGNTVIVFDPAQNRFYRYGHLASVEVDPGQVIEVRHAIGTVGHSGFHAARPKHGGHLHFEINEFDGSTVRSLSSAEIWRMLEQARQ